MQTYVVKFKSFKSVIVLRLIISQIFLKKLMKKNQNAASASNLAYSATAAASTAAFASASYFAAASASNLACSATAAALAV